MARIVAVLARQVWDSRGRPTVEAEVRLEDGATGRAIAPSGASTGRREALDRRDGGTRLGGFGVDLALAAIREVIAPGLAGLEAADQASVDTRLIALDGTAQKTRLGGNAMVATSLAVAWAAANASRMPLWQHLAALSGAEPRIPLPMIQIFGGGRHAGNCIDIQDFLVMALGPRTFPESCEMAAEVYFAAADAMAQRGRLHGIADEGGVWPDFSTNKEVLEHLTLAIEQAGFRPGIDMGIAIDVAASAFAVEGGYRLALEGRTLSTAALSDMLASCVDTYPIVSIEDPLGEDDDTGFVEITARLGDRVQIIGDDYLVTDAARIERAAEQAACNAALLKVNQCGTVTELIAAAQATRRAGWNAVQSGRSGESEDVSLSHLAVGLGCEQIKVGSMARAERTAKWNEVIRIAEGDALSCWQFALAR